MKLINKSSIDLIEVVDKKLALIYHPGRKKTFWREGIESGFYTIRGIYTPQELEEGKYNNTPMLVYGEEAYYKPYLRIWVGGQESIITHKTYEGAKSHAMDLAKGFDDILIL